MTANAHWYTYPSVRVVTAASQARPMSASSPVRSRAVPTCGRQVRRAERHGRHTNAAATPSSSPLDRVTVDRYRKLVRSTSPNRGPGPVTWIRKVTAMTVDGQPGEQAGAAGGGDPAPHQQQERQRPQQVELLLDPEAPQVAQQRRRVGVVGHVAEDLAPVAGVEGGPRQVRAQLRQLRAVATDDRDDRDDDEHHDECRQQPAGAAQPELAELDVAAAGSLLEQQGGDQEPGEDEEHLEADVAAVHPREAGVVRHDDEQPDGAQAVEAGLVAHPRRPAARSVRVELPLTPLRPRQLAGDRGRGDGSVRHGGGSVGTRWHVSN